MLSNKLAKAINKQINAEFWSAYLYLSMSVDANANGHKGVANWFFIQYQEEMDHARIFINYLLSRGARVELMPIEEVKTSWKTPLAAFKDTLEHEQKVTAMINELCGIAAEEKDFASSSMLKWFVDEQVEEEENAKDIIDSLVKVDDSKLGLYMIDKELAARTYTVPAPLSAK